MTNNNLANTLVAIKTNLSETDLLYDQQNVWSGIQYISFLFSKYCLFIK